MSQAIEIGRIVTLRSGGPAMTVETVEGSTMKCVWFEGTQILSRQFDFALLRPPEIDAEPDVGIDNFG